MNIYVCNLSHVTTDTELREAFGEFGFVSAVSLTKDRFTGQPRGFAFVEMPTELNASAAIARLNGRDFGGRRLSVSAVRPLEAPRQSEPVEGQHPATGAFREAA